MFFFIHAANGWDRRKEQRKGVDNESRPLMKRKISKELAEPGQRRVGQAGGNSAFDTQVIIKCRLGLRCVALYILYLTM